MINKLVKEMLKNDVDIFDDIKDIKNTIEYIKFKKTKKYYYVLVGVNNYTFNLQDLISLILNIQHYLDYKYNVFIDIDFNNIRILKVV